MPQGLVRVVAVSALLVMDASAGEVRRAQAQPAKAETPYPQMAPLAQYLIPDRDAEIALARSAAPRAISDNAEVLVLGPHGYEMVAKGTNGFACLVLRSWTAGFDDPEFWNPKLRGPNCYNPQAVRSYLPLLIARTRWVLAGRSKAQMVDAIKAGLDKRELPTPEAGAMTYMMSKQGYLSDQGGHWHPHLMFFVPQADVQSWGAGLTGSPVLGVEDAPDRLTVFLVPIRRWSDGTADVDH